MRWHYRDAALLWPFVPAYVVHVTEEWFGGFPLWIGTVVGRPLPNTAYLLINAIALVLIVIHMIVIAVAFASARMGGATG